MSRFLLLPVCSLVLVLSSCDRPAIPTPGPAPASAWGGVPFLDLAADTARQVVVDREPGQYLGHPTTHLLPDGRTVLAVYPEGHGAGAIVLKRSADGGRTWSERLPVPESWETSREVPTLYGVQGAAGNERLLLFSGLYPIRMSRSEDGGATWTALEPIGDFGGIVAMASLERRRSDGVLMAFFHDDGRFLEASGEPGRFRVFVTESADEGLTWGAPRVIAESDSLDLCEPGVIRSPDGRTLVALLRENRRVGPSQWIASEDEGRTWSQPRPLAAALTGDRHVGVYTPGGRLVVSFRDMGEGSPTRGDWLAWIGSFEELVSGEASGYRVRLMDNRNDWDAAYPALEVLPDGSVLATTYGHWMEGEAPYIVSVRFRIDELDRMRSAGGDQSP